MVVVPADWLLAGLMILQIEHGFGGKFRLFSPQGFGGETIL
jgi:hypothetical protein